MKPDYSSVNGFEERIAKIKAANQRKKKLNSYISKKEYDLNCKKQLLMKDIQEINKQLKRIATGEEREAAKAFSNERLDQMIHTLRVTKYRNKNKLKGDM